MDQCSLDVPSTHCRAVSVTYSDLHVSQSLTETQKRLKYISPLALYTTSLTTSITNSSRRPRALPTNQLHPTTKHAVLAAYKNRRHAIASAGASILIYSAITHLSRLRPSLQLPNSFQHNPSLPKLRTLQVLQTPRRHRDGRLLPEMRPKRFAGR